MGQGTRMPFSEETLSPVGPRKRGQSLPGRPTGPLLGAAAATGGGIFLGAGAVIVNAKVAATNMATNAKVMTVSNDAGDYLVPSLPPGAYTVRVEKEGFRAAVMTGIELNASATIRADVTLEVGSVTQAVEVTATALQLHTEDAKSGVTITGEMVDKVAVVEMRVIPFKAPMVAASVPWDRA